MPGWNIQFFYQSLEGHNVKGVLTIQEQTPPTRFFFPKVVLTQSEKSCIFVTHDLFKWVCVWVCARRPPRCLHTFRLFVGHLDSQLVSLISNTFLFIIIFTCYHEPLDMFLRSVNTGRNTIHKTDLGNLHHELRLKENESTTTFSLLFTSRGKSHAFMFICLYTFAYVLDSLCFRMLYVYISPSLCVCISMCLCGFLWDSLPILLCSSVFACLNVCLSLFSLFVFFQLSVCVFMCVFYTSVSLVCVCVYRFEKEWEGDR